MQEFEFDSIQKAIVNGMGEVARNPQVKICHIKDDAETRLDVDLYQVTGTMINPKGEGLFLIVTKSQILSLNFAGYQRAADFRDLFLKKLQTVGWRKEGSIDAELEKPSDLILPNKNGNLMPPKLNRIQ